MKWIECSDRMDQYVIKKDGTAVDIEYFMATHVPFRDLELIEFGDADTKPIHLSEEQIYEQYIVNKAEKHQMLIVRGTHGSGKSHLICWLHNRFVSDPVNYNPESEKVIFLRRLRNTVRGAVQQMLDEGIVKDKNLKEKFEKFTSSTESQSEEEFKATIYSEYARKAQTDSTAVVFKPIVCKNIAAFLYDIRVQEYMMRPDGPVDRCYQKITAGATSVSSDETGLIFTEKDFVFPGNVANSIKKESAEEVRNFYLNDLRGDDALIKKLVDYLNHFTSGVIQSCANITSENARELFVNLRKSLHKEGKKLTIFIEDFTSFSIVESELITALSVENGGNYSDLCRVTSVIGITDGYYGSFRDNFKTRVTKQIKVTEQSFGGEDFLLEMVARYLNSIYSKPEVVKNWYKGNAVGDTLPVAEYKPEFEWDSVHIGDADCTMYPFNRKSLLTLYDKLKVKTTRNFLTYVIQHFFHSFADGMEYKDDWRFPELPPYIETVTLQPPYADSVENASVSDEDKQRLKVLFSIWGNGTTEADEKTVGGISKDFLADIALGSFAGISSVSKREDDLNELVKLDKRQEGGITPKAQPTKLSEEEISFNRRKQDIEAWFEEKKTLEYSSDYNKWLGDFVIQGIAWQDEGLPGELVVQRKNNGNFVDIEDSKLSTNRDKAVVVLNRSSEARTVLMGLLLFDFYKNWSFENAAYYQMILVSWLEKNKATFIDNIFGKTVGSKEHPILTWCLAAEYLQRVLFGEKLKLPSNDKLLRKLLISKVVTKYDQRLNQNWNDVITYLTNQSSMMGRINTLLTSGSKTIMGIVGDGAGGKVPFYRTRELLNSIEHLESKNWDISDELEVCDSYQYEAIRNYLKGLYTRVQVVLESECELAKATLKKFDTLVGKEPTEKVYIDIIGEIQEFYSNCSMAHEPYRTAIKIKFDEEPQEQAKKAIGIYARIKEDLSKLTGISLLEFFSQRPIEQLNEIIEDLNEVETDAARLQEKHKMLIGDEEFVDPPVLEAALTKLEELGDRIEKLEVAE